MTKEHLKAEKQHHKNLQALIAVEKKERREAKEELKLATLSAEERIYREFEEEAKLEANEIFTRKTVRMAVTTETFSSASIQTPETLISKKEEIESQLILTIDPTLEERANAILLSDPYQFLLDDLHKRVPGNQLISKMLLLSFMSLHPKINVKLHQLITGASGRGKSYEIHQCADLLPFAYKIPVEHISAKALNYYCRDDGTAEEGEMLIPGIIKDKLLYLDDVSESDVEILKTLGNNDGKDPSGLNVVNQKTVHWQWDGYPLTICSKVSLPETDEDGQIASRYLIYGIDESPEHLQEITDNMMAKEMKLTTPIDPDPVCEIILHTCLQLPISRIELTTPHYPSKIEPRNLNFYIGLIKSNALLNHKNRIIKDGILYTNEEDLIAINSLWNKISSHNNVNLTTLEIKILNNLKRSNEPRSRDQTIPGMKELGFGSSPTIAGAIRKLEKVGMIGSIGQQGKKGKSYFLL